MTGSPPIPTHVDWPMPGVGHRLDGLVGQRPRTGHDPDPALAVDRARDDPDLGPAGRGRAGAVRPDQAGAGRPDHLDDRDHVERRDALGDAEDRPDPGGGRLHDRVRRAGRRDEDARRVGAGLADGVGDRVEHGHPAVQRGLAALAGRHPGDDLGAVLEHRGAMERALAAGQAVDDDPARRGR